MFDWMFTAISTIRRWLVMALFFVVVIALFSWLRFWAALFLFLGVLAHFLWELYVAPTQCDRCGRLVDRSFDECPRCGGADEC